MIVSLHTSALAPMAHEAVVLPWLERAARNARHFPSGVAALVPQRTDGYFLKSLAIERRLPLWGVHFLTPGEMRNRLAAHLSLGGRVPLREHLRLMLTTAADHVAESHPDARGVGAGPDQLLKTIDLLGGAGWRFDEAGPTRLRPLVTEFERLVKAVGWKLMHAFDRDARDAAGVAARPCFVDLLVVGFNAAHWPLWPLLEAAVRSSERSEVCLLDPRSEDHDFEAAWIGTWEESFASAQPAPADWTPAFTEWLRVPEAKEDREQREAKPAQNIDFLVAHDTAEQARAVVAKAAQYLAQGNCRRLGILFPKAGALSRRVACLLSERGIAHHDGLPHLAPGDLELCSWGAWLALQENPRLSTLRAFLQSAISLSKAPIRFGDLDAQGAIEALDQVGDELLIDDLAVIEAYASGHPRERWQALGAGLRDLAYLPVKETFGAYADATAKIFTEFGWTEHRLELGRAIGDWEKGMGLRISRTGWIRWLREVLVSWQTRRAELGSHPYSRLHLIPYSQAEAQSWTHLIATSLNEEHWPPQVDESGFLDEDEIAALNRNVRALNRRAARRGRQGEGHLAVTAGHSLCLGPQHRRAILERQFLNTLESTTDSITLTAQMTDEAAPERPLGPGEYFTRLHLCARGRTVSGQTMETLHKETRRWLARFETSPSVAEEFPEIKATRRAFDARRAADEPFGEFEFALKNSPTKAPRMSATDWESAIRNPALTFLAKHLGVTPAAEPQPLAWPKTQGTWAHRWLSVIPNAPGPATLMPFPSPADIRSRVKAAAHAFRDAVSGALARRGRHIPDWWHSAWEEALSMTLSFAGTLGGLSGWSHAATEWRIEETPVQLAGGALRVRGRADLLLADGASLEKVWLVDYKTGDRDPLKLENLAKGDGVQLALYALAMREAGARNAGVSLLTPDGILDQPQLDAETCASADGLWRCLLRMQDFGVFGCFGPIRDEFSFSQAYPLATLAVDTETLAEKWQRTHPELAPEDQDE